MVALCGGPIPNHRQLTGQRLGRVDAQSDQPCIMSGQDTTEIGKEMCVWCCCVLCVVFLCVVLVLVVVIVVVVIVVLIAVGFSCGGGVGGGVGVCC